MWPELTIKGTLILIALIAVTGISLERLFFPGWLDPESWTSLATRVALSLPLFYFYSALLAISYPNLLKDNPDA